MILVVHIMAVSETKGLLRDPVYVGPRMPQGATRDSPTGCSGSSRSLGYGVSILDVG